MGSDIRMCIGTKCSSICSDFQVDATSGESHQQAITSLREFAEKFPKALAPRRLLLNLVSGMTTLAGALYCGFEVLTFSSF